MGDLRYDLGSGLRPGTTVYFRLVASLCAAHGVRVAYSQAYHHQANGRGESAGQKIMLKLKKLISHLLEPGFSWLELLPKALRAIHDLPGGPVCLSMKLSSDVTGL